MDKQIIFAVMVAVGVMAGFSGCFLSAPENAPPRPAYAPDDIRAKYQQAEAKKAKRKQPAPAQAPTVVSGDSSSGRSSSSSDSSDESVEAPAAEEPEAEEPPLD
jgi:hypothetical protein